MLRVARPQLTHDSARESKQCCPANEYSLQGVRLADSPIDYSAECHSNCHCGVTIEGCVIHLRQSLADGNCKFDNILTTEHLTIVT